MSKGGDLTKYGRSDWHSESGSRKAMYELCRETGEPHDMAARHADAGARQLSEQLAGDRTAMGRVERSASMNGAGTPPNTGRCKRRTPWPWEGQSDEPSVEADGDPPSS